jgi:hypothetical protein
MNKRKGWGNKKIYYFLLSLVIFSFLGFISIAFAQTIEYKVTSGDKSVTLTNEYDLDDGSSSHSHIDVSCNPSLSQDRTMDLVGDNIIEQTIEGETNGNTNYKGISIVGTGLAEELTATITSYSTHDTHSLDQTLNGSGDVIWSIVGAGNISTTGNGIEIDPVQGTMTIDAGAQGEGAVAGVGAFGNAKIVNTTLHADTSHSASASANVGEAEGDFVVAGAGAGNIEANLEAEVGVVDPSQGIIGAQGDLFLDAEGAVAVVGAFEKGKIKNTTLSADTSHSAHASANVGEAEGLAVVAGAGAGNIYADLEGGVTTTLEWPPTLVDASGTINAGAEAAVIGGAVVGNPFENAKIVNTALNVDTSHSAHASGDVYAMGAAVVAGAAAGNVQASSDSFAIGAEGAVIGGWGSRGGILALPPQDEWFQDAYMIDATNLNVTTKIGAGTSVEGDVAVAGGLFPDSVKAAGVAAGYALFNSGGLAEADGQQEGLDRPQIGPGVISGHGTASVNKDVPEFDAEWND